MATKSKVVTVRLTEEQRKKLENMAAAARTSESWVVQSLIEHSQVVAGAMFVGAAPLPKLQNGDVKNG